MTKRRIAGALAAAALAAAACGGGETTDAVDEPAAQEEQQQEETTNALDVGMGEYDFGIGGEAQAGPLALNFTNNGEQLHHAIIGKLDEGKTIDDVNKLLKKGLDGPPPPWFDDSPIDMTVLSPGNSAGVVVDAEPGTYVLLCFMPTPKGQPHVAEGMVQSFDVAESDEPAEAPEPDDSISMTEDGPEAPELPSGPSVLEVTNDAEEPGEVFVLRLAEGKTIDDIDAWFKKGQKGPAPVEFFGGTHAFEPGESVLLTLDLEPGTYQISTTYGEGKNRKDTPVDFTV